MIRNALQRFMYGRYGRDQLNTALLAFTLICYVLFFITRLELLYWISFVSILFALFRMFSRRIDRRRAENARFLKVAGPAIQWFRLRRTIHRDKEHRYFRCPSCGQQLRVPKGKGKIEITCPNCRNHFIKRS